MSFKRSPDIAPKAQTKMGRIIEEHRHAKKPKGWSQTTLANESGCSLPSIYRYEGGYRRPENAVFHHIADALDMDEDTRKNLLDIDSPDPENTKKLLHHYTGGGNMIGAVIYHLRNEKGWSQPELAEKMSCKHATICNFELGKNVPDEKMAKKFASIFRLKDAIRPDETGISKDNFIELAERSREAAEARKRVR